MTRAELNAIADYLGESVQKPMGVAQREIYFDLLGDLPAVAVHVAAQRALLEGEYPVVPTIGTLRRLAVEALQGDRAAPPWGEAWLLFKQAAFNKYRRAELHPAIRTAGERIGWSNFCDSACEDEATWRAQFRQVYEQCEERYNRLIRLPEPVRKLLSEVSKIVVEPLANVLGKEFQPARLTDRSPKPEGKP